MVIVALQADHSDFEIAEFLKVARSFVFKICNQIQKDKGNESQTLRRKKHSKRSDMIRKDDFIYDVQQIIDNNPRKSTRSLPNNFQVLEGTIRNVVHENIKYKFYVVKKGQFLSEKVKNQLLRLKRLLNKIKHSAEEDVIWFFSDEKKF